MSGLMPENFTVNGIQRFGITIVDRQSVPLDGNTMRFTTLSFAVHAGISILEKLRGRETLAQLGLAVIEEWTNGGNFRFNGDASLMKEYVNKFLHAIRSDFPRVILDTLGGPDVIAEARRIACQDHTLAQYNPKNAGGIYYSLSQVSHMASAADEANEVNAHGKKMTARYKTYLFKFAVATAHELAHLFVGYLAQGQDTIYSYTPPPVSFLNYAGFRSPTGVPLLGESGRWLESRLFGGSIEFYRDVLDDDNQAGIPYVLDAEGLARRIQRTCITDLVTNLNEFSTFPFATRGRALTSQERRERHLLSMGSTDGNGTQSDGTFMRSRREWSGPLYNISANELCRVPLEPSRILIKTVVT